MWVTKAGVKQKIDDGALQFWLDEGWAPDENLDGVADDAGGSGTSGLWTPDITKGYQGRFGASHYESSFTLAAGQTNIVEFAQARHLEDNDNHEDLIDTSYMHWDPDDPTKITVKQAGWYVVCPIFFFDAPLPVSINFGVDPIFGSTSGNNPIDIDIPAGGGAGNGWGFGVPAWFPANNTLSLKVHTLLADPIPGAYAALVFAPMFELA